MRSSRSGSARGLRSAGSPPEPSSTGGRSRSGSTSSTQPKPKRRGRGLPLSNVRNQHSNGDEKDDFNKNAESSPANDENEHSKHHEDAISIKGEPNDPKTPQTGQSSHKEHYQHHYEGRLQALQDGRPVYVTATVLGAVVDMRDVVSKGVGQDGNQFFCEICKGFGNVVCCDGCPKVYHAACIDPSDPARKGLDNDDDPWFCGSCRSRGNSTRGLSTQTKKASLKNAPTSSASIQPDKNVSRPERRTSKRKCNECQQAGGEMKPCTGCGVNYIHILPCRGDDDSTDGSREMCSDCRAEAIVKEEEDENGADDVDLELSKSPNNSRGQPSSGSSRGVRHRLSSPAHDQDIDAETSEEGSLEVDEDDEVEEEEDEEEDDELEEEVAYGEELPEKKTRKRANSDFSESKKKKKMKTASVVKPKKQGKEKKKSMKMKIRKVRLHADEERGDFPSKSEPSPRRSQATTGRGLVQATPAFFFFLNDSKFKIERVLARKHKYFNRLPKGAERNELIAREGARWWLKLRPIEQKRYFTISMRDFEEKVIEWKEEKTIREMMAARDPDDRCLDGYFDPSDDSQDPSPEDEMMMYSKHERLFLASSVGSKPFTPEPGKSNNRILFELLQDMRFHPMPMFNPLRSDGQSGLIDRRTCSIPHFEVEGPVATSAGDECSGCTRGWNHFCPVLKRRIPAIENRARLQPPLSSLMATRVGLGLKSKIPELDEDKGNESELFDIRLSHEAREAMRVPAIPSFTLTHPSERADDVVYFVEECLAMKVLEPPRPSPPDVRIDLQKKKTTPSRGLLPLRARRKLDESSDDVPISEGIDTSKSVLNKCGRCRTIIDNDTGCIQCRRAQLVINTSKRIGPSGQTSPGNDKRCKDAVRVQTTMIGRLTVKETNFEDQTETDKRIANAMLQLRWMPSAVLPPHCTVAPRRKPTTVDRERRVAERENSSAQGGRFQPSSGVVEDDNGESKVPLDHSEDAGEPSIDNDGGGDVDDESRPSRLRPRKLHSVHGVPELGDFHDDDLDTERNIDRQRLAVVHKEGAAELAKRCLNVACCGIFLAIVRRDPLCLFAEPVPSNVIGYSVVVVNPIDISQIKSKILQEKYTSLFAFVSDVRLLCNNALAFNPPGSIYSKTAKELHEAIDIMHKRATRWVSAIKTAHASSFAWRGTDASHEDRDPFRDLRSTWPEAVEMLDNGDWLLEQISSDFMRTKENESAYYGSIAIRRAAAAADASLASYTDTGGIHSAVIRRSHTDDENLRRFIDSKVAQLTGPVRLADVPRWREESILRILRRVQSRRVEGLVMSENGSARCDGIRTDAKLALNAIRWGRNKRKGELATLPRVDQSRLSLTTGLASKSAQERIGREFDRSEVVEMRTEEVDEAETEEETPVCLRLDDKTEMEPLEEADVVDQWDKKLEVAVTVQGSPVHGWGLFADQPFKKGDVVAEYVGEYISNAVADAREKIYQERRIQDYQFRVDENLVIDATLKGGHGRYINHNCNPNCMAKIVDGQPPNKHLKRVMIIAQRDIKAREEITYDYQFPLELDLDERIPCNCGSLLCRGFMNWDLPEKGSKNRVLRTQKRGGNMRDRIRRLGRPLKKQDEK